MKRSRKPPSEMRLADGWRRSAERKLRVERLRKAVRNGAYHVTADVVAASILRHAHAAN